MTHRESSTLTTSPATLAAGRRIVLRLAAFGKSAGDHLRTILAIVELNRPPVELTASDSRDIHAAMLEAIKGRAQAALHLIDDAAGGLIDSKLATYAVTPAGRAALATMGDDDERGGVSSLRSVVEDALAADAFRPYGAASSTRAFEILREEIQIARPGADGVTCDHCHQPLSSHPVELHTRDGENGRRRLVCLAEARQL